LLCGPKNSIEYCLISDNPSTTNDAATKKARMNCSSWMWEKIKSSPKNVGDIGNPVSPKQANRKKIDAYVYSDECP
jgi:hypothetical protein